MTPPFTPGQPVRHRTGDTGSVIRCEVVVKDHTGREVRWLIENTEAHEPQQKERSA